MVSPVEGRHVALYIGSLCLGGAEHVMVNLAEALYARGWRVTLVTTYLADEEYEVPHGLWRRLRPDEEPREKDSRILDVLSTDERRVQVERMSWKADPGPAGNGIDRIFSGVASEAAGGRINGFLRRRKRLEEIWKEIKPDVILSFIGKNNLMALLTAPKFHIPVVVSVRAIPELEYPGRFMKTAAMMLFGRAEAVAVQTEAVAGFFPQRVRRRAAVIPNAVSAEFLTDDADGEPKRERTIVAVGRMDANKRFDLLLRAFSRILHEETGSPKAEGAIESNKYRLILYGDGEDRPKLEKLARDLEIADRTDFMGRCHGIADRIRNAGIFCLMSDTEGMPNTLIEAMCLGIPSVTTDCIPGGIGQLAADGENALVIPPGDENALTAAIRRIMTDPELAMRLSRNARGLRERYDPDRVTDAWEELLKRAIGSRT